MHVGTAVVEVPDYLEKYYWWAYVRPWATRVFERPWLASAILFGYYSCLRDDILDEFGASPSGATLQISCCYGNLTPEIARRAQKGGGALDVVDVLEVQLQNLARKLPPEAPVSLHRMNSTALSFESNRFDRALIFFLLHEQPPSVRLATIREALRVLKPNGTLVIVDYGKPALWHPARYFVIPILRTVEPFAWDLWSKELSVVVPQLRQYLRHRKTYFGGLYQKLTYIKR